MNHILCNFVSKFPLYCVNGYFFKKMGRHSSIPRMLLNGQLNFLLRTTQAHQWDRSLILLTECGEHGYLSIIWQVWAVLKKKLVKTWCSYWFTYWTIKQPINLFYSQLRNLSKNHVYSILIIFSARLKTHKLGFYCCNHSSHSCPTFWHDG